MSREINKVKERSVFILSIIGYLLLVFGIVVMARSNSVPEEHIFTPPPEKMLCFNLSSKELRTSDTKLMCDENEESLGTEPIGHGTDRPTALNRTFEVRFLAAQAAAEKLGYKLRITSGFRSQDLQAKLFADAVKKYGSEVEASKWVLPRDISHHPWGTAIDVNYPGDKIAVKWLEENGSLFGLCRVYENEWWHFEPLISPGGICPKLLVNALESLGNSPTSAPTNN